MNKKHSTDLKTLATVGLLIGIQIILGRFFSIRTPIVVIGFGFLPIVIAAILYGPVKASLVAGVSDFLGALMFPVGAYFPGFTLTAFVTGAMYGVFLHNKHRTLMRIIVACFVVGSIDLLMNTYWLTILTGKGALVLLPPRMVQAAILFAVKLVTIQILDKQLINRFILKPS